MSFIENLETFGSQTALQNENGDIVSYQDLARTADSLSEEISFVSSLPWSTYC